MGCFPDKMDCLGRNEVRGGKIGPLKGRIGATPFLIKQDLASGIPAVAWNTAQAE